MFRFFIIALLFVQLSASAQINVSPQYKSKSKYVAGSPGLNTLYDAVDMSFDEALNFLEGSTTYFIVPKGVSEADQTELTTKLNAVWTLTDKVELISMADFSATDYRGQKANFISMVGNFVPVNKSYAFSPYSPPYKNYKPKNTITTHNRLSFWAFDDEKRFRSFGGIELTYNVYSWYKKYKRDLKKMHVDFVNNAQYEGNWFNGYIINGLQLIQEKIKSKKAVGGDYRLAQQVQLSLLKEKTLYIPNYVLEHRRGYTKEKDLLKSYHHPVQVISKEELNTKIMSSSEPVYYLIGTSSNDTEFVSVFNSKTGAIVYHDYIGNSIKLKGKHLEKLARVIDKYK